MTLPAIFEQDRLLIEDALERLLPSEETPPAAIHRAMRYSVLAGGKRIRPILCLEAAGAISDNAPGAAELGCALEFIHTYSLIHDDLPALDNDDVRRGLPTSHKKFGEAVAILAGDALLTLAFERLAQLPIEASRRTRIIEEVAHAAGTVNGMVGGQVADLEATAGAANAAAVDYIHRAKTGAMIRAAVRTGAICAGAEEAKLEHLSRYGENIGLAFQIIDDILDVESSSQALGKTAGKDQSQRKATYPAVHGLERSRQMTADLVCRACEELGDFGRRGERLRQLAAFLASRRN